MQYELEFYSTTAPQMAVVEQAVRAMGPVQAMEIPGLERFNPQVALLTAGPTSVPQVQVHAASNPFTGSNPALNPSPPRDRTPRMSHAPQLKKCRALYDFVPQEAGELPFRVGEELSIVEDIGSGWYKARNASGQEGLIPGNYVQT